MAQQLGADVPERLCQILTPVGMLGYGFPETQIIAALEELVKLPTPTALILDSGSTDSGPSKLALGSMTCPRASYERDLGRLLRLVVKYKVPLLISSAGGDGSDEHVDELVKIVSEIADRSENRYMLTPEEHPCCHISHANISVQLMESESPRDILWNLEGANSE